MNVVVEDQQASWAGKPLYEIEAWDLFLEVPDRDNKAEMKVLLDHVSFKALPGDMIALMGPSGAGKTTLLLTLNGYLPPTSGQVRINGEDLYAIYDALRGVHRLRPAGRHRPPRAHRLRGGEVLGALPPPARLLARRRSTRASSRRSRTSASSA